MLSQHHEQALLRIKSNVGQSHEERVRLLFVCPTAVIWIISLPFGSNGNLVIYSKYIDLGISFISSFCLSMPSSNLGLLDFFCFILATPTPVYVVVNMGLWEYGIMVAMQK